MLSFLLRRSLPTRLMLCSRGYSTRQNKKLRVASSSSLWVSYMDIATVRKRLVSVAQEVRFQLEKDGMEPLPEIRLPQEGRVRHGFWFMAFEREALKLTAAQSLRDRQFATECGSPARPKWPSSQQSYAAIHRSRSCPGLACEPRRELATRLPNRGEAALCILAPAQGRRCHRPLAIQAPSRARYTWTMARSRTTCA